MTRVRNQNWGVFGYRLGCSVKVAGGYQQESQPLHSPAGEKRGGVDAISLGGDASDAGRYSISFHNPQF